MAELVRVDDGADGLDDSTGDVDGRALFEGDLLGHSSLGVTADIYTDVVDALQGGGRLPDGPLFR